MLNQHLLLIDNETDFVDISAMLLKLHGYRVSSFYDGPSALAAIEELKPDAILLDIGMPPIDGYEVCRRIRAEPWGQTVALIALTGFGRAIDIERAFEAGFNAHVLKPADINHLIEVVTDCIKTRHSR